AIRPERSAIERSWSSVLRGCPRGGEYGAGRFPGLDALDGARYATEESHGTHAARQGVGGAHGPDAAVRPDPAPDRPPPHPRGDDAAGLPDAQGAEAEGPHARAHVRHARPHHPDG